MGREGNTLSPIIRRAWDDGNPNSLVKNSPCRASARLISIIGHITAHELRQYLDRTEAANGFANRFLFVCVRRSKLLPEGGCLPDSDVSAAQWSAKGARVRHVGSERSAGTMKPASYGFRLREPLGGTDPPARCCDLGKGRGAGPCVLAMLYALLDGSLPSAQLICRLLWQVWEYCEASARCIFGRTLGDQWPTESSRALRSTPGASGEPRSLTCSVATRIRLGSMAPSASWPPWVSRSVREVTGGRPGERWFAC